MINGTQEVNKLFGTAELEKKIDLLLEQNDLLLRSNARLRAEIPNIIKEAISLALNKHRKQGYSRIAGGV